jgi:hypothetical protein
MVSINMVMQGQKSNTSWWLHKLYAAKLSPNFHFVGAPAQFAPFKVPRAIENTPTQEQLSTPRPSMENDHSINVESEDEVVEVPRTEKRILYTQEEDVRMVSCTMHVFSQFIFPLFEIQ